jgi:hypothetical protein
MKAGDKTVQSSKSDAMPPYEPTPAEAEAVAAYQAAKAKAGPSLKIDITEKTQSRSTLITRTTRLGLWLL